MNQELLAEIVIFGPFLLMAGWLGIMVHLRG